MFIRKYGRHLSTGKDVARRRVMSHCFALTVLLVLMALPASAQIALSGSVTAGGGGHARSAGGCLAIDGTLGESMAGSASGGGFALTSGYWARIDPHSRDSLFNAGFEECQ